MCCDRGGGRGSSVYTTTTKNKRLQTKLNEVSVLY